MPPKRNNSKPKPKPIRKLLVANRSEIAIRVMRAATELGIRTVAIFAQEDRFCTHRFKADEAYQLNPKKGPVGAYLDYDGIVALAKEKGVDAIHPGYGFLSESPDFARACDEAGILFIGPDAEVLERLGDKTEARKVAESVGVPILQGTKEPVKNRTRALSIGRKIGFPLIIKAAFGGGGRGMRIVHKEDDLEGLLDEAKTEAERAFGNGAVFLEKFVGKAKHIEVQIIADKHGNALHLFERDCSVQRRHQKVIEMAPSHGLDSEVLGALYDAALKIAQAVGYTHAGTVEFLVDTESGDWFFIEMNPRIQVEHTVTEEVTSVDIVGAQIQIAMGHELHGDAMLLPRQDEVQKSGVAIQCRITTEDPENAFTPDFGQILTYRSPGGFGVRLDGALGAANAIVTPYYDSMLVKLTVFGRNFENALDRIDRCLCEFRIRGVKTNIPFLLNVARDSSFRAGQATTRFIDENPGLFRFKPRKDRATKLLDYISDVTVNKNPHAKGYQLNEEMPAAVVPAFDHTIRPPAGTRDRLLNIGPQKFAEWITKQKRLLITDTTFRDAHQSLLATRVRTYDMLRLADCVARRTPDLFSLEMWGGATFDTAMRFLKEDPWERLSELRKCIPNICFQMLFRGSNAVGYTNYPDNVVTGFIRHAAAAGMDIFRIFDSLNYTPNLKAAMEAVHGTHALCEATLCYTGDILSTNRDKYSLRYYVALAKELEGMGAHMLAIKDMAGLCRPYAATKLVKALKNAVGIPIHFHTHDTSGINAASILTAAEAGVDIADAAVASMSGGTSQPNLNSVVAALQHTPRDTKLDLQALNEYSDYWAVVRDFYKPFDTSEPYGTADVYLHEMPGGQYTNLKEQANAMGIGHRWQEIARCYAEVNVLFGDIVKVTPSSKVVGDMTMFLIARGIKPEHVVNMPPNTAWPESVIDMLKGGLGQPIGGWPKKVQKAILGRQKPTTRRPGALAKPVKFEYLRDELTGKLGREPDENEVWSYLMYPQVFLDFAKFRERFGDVSVLPSPAFFYGLLDQQEVSVDIEPGKTLFIRLLHVSDVDEEGHRRAIFELNGYPRHVTVIDNSVSPETEQRPRADISDPNQIGAPMPGLVASVVAEVGQKVKEGDPLLTLEAMKMFTTVSALANGTVAEVLVGVGDHVEPKDLLIRLN
jgi:pyruvate carboxylase